MNPPPPRRSPPGHSLLAIPPLAVPLLAGPLLAAPLALGACGTGAEAGGSTDVLYAGSLTAIMEDRLGPAYEGSGPRAYRGEGRGSVAAAHQIREGVRRPDVYITADTATLTTLGSHYPGWAVAFARGEIAIGYAASGRYAAALDSGARGVLAWHEVLTREDFRLGRTDPDLDPKGYRTLWMFELAERHYRRPGLADRLRAVAAPERVFPEEHLAVRVEAGQLDAAVFYLAEARAHGLEVIRLPPEVNLGDPEHADLYASLSYRDRDDRLFRGGPILYAATIPTSAPDPEAGAGFLRFLLDEPARRILSDTGFPPVRRVLGARERAPQAVTERAAE